MVVGCAVIFAMLMPDIYLIRYPFQARLWWTNSMCLLCLGSFAYG
jgi:hypothetical protein